MSVSKQIVDIKCVYNKNLYTKIVKNLIMDFIPTVEIKNIEFLALKKKVKPGLLFRERRNVSFLLI